MVSQRIFPEPKLFLAKQVATPSGTKAQTRGDSPHAKLPLQNTLNNCTCDTCRQIKRSDFESAEGIRYGAPEGLLLQQEGADVPPGDPPDLRARPVLRQLLDALPGDVCILLGAHKHGGPWLLWAATTHRHVKQAAGNQKAFEVLLCSCSRMQVLAGEVMEHESSLWVQDVAYTCTVSSRRTFFAWILYKLSSL